MEVFKDLKFNIVHLNSTTSTNIHAHQFVEKSLQAEGTVFYTDFQENGKGQKGSKWQSDRGFNLLMSLVLTPNLKVQKRFLISQAVSLALISTLDKLSVNDLSIKWPNDILVANKKIAGILIENSIKGDLINNSIVGIGLNINQIEFSDMEREPTSLKLLLKENLDIMQVLNSLLVELKGYYSILNTNPKFIKKSYNETLYGRELCFPFQDEDSSFEGVIKGVNSTGELQIQIGESIKNYGLKELKFKA